MSMMDNVMVFCHGNKFNMLRSEAIDFFSRCATYCNELWEKTFYNSIVKALESGANVWTDDTY